MARKTHPTGSEIAEHAARTKFHEAKAVRATRDKDNVSIRFTPAIHENLKKDQAEEGIVLGQADADLGQYQTDLRPGKYHVFVAKVGDTWRAYGELNGEIAAKAKSVTVTEESSPRDLSQEMPRIRFGSVCFQFCIIVGGFPYCWEVCL